MSDFLALAGWAAECRSADQNAYLLIDGAQVPNSHLRLKKLHVHFESLFSGTREESLIDIAPLLIPLRDLSSELLKTVCRWALSLGAQAPCLSWMRSTLTLPELAGHLRNFHAVGLSEGQSMLMRWYDTRILPGWLRCLTPDQLSDFTSGMFDFHCMDRFGDQILGHKGASPSTPSSEPPLGQPLIHLTDIQLGALIEESETDALIAHLRQVIKDETSQLPYRQLFEFVQKYQRQAAKAGVRDQDRQTQYVLLALYTSGRGADHPLCQAIMREPPSSMDAFFSALQTLPDEVWKAAGPLWF